MPGDANANGIPFFIDDDSGAIPASGFLLLEDDTNLLLEDATELLLEG